MGVGIGLQTGSGKLGVALLVLSACPALVREPLSYPILRLHDTVAVPAHVLSLVLPVCHPVLPG